MADCGNTLCCVGCIGEAIPRPVAIACLIVSAPILLIVGIMLSAECVYEGPYCLIAGALLCGLVVLLLYPIQQANTNKYAQTNSSETERIYKTNKCTHIIVGCIWIFIVLPSIITAIILLTSYPCFTTNWRKKKCIVKDINATECSSFFGGDGYYYQYVLEAKSCNNDNSGQCVYDDSNIFTDCEQSRDYSIGDSIPCWVYYDENVCQECDCNECSDGSRGAMPEYVPIIDATEHPTLSPTTHQPSQDTPSPIIFEWNAEMCVVVGVNTTDCNVVGNYYKYALQPQNSTNVECIYDDSNGETDCEFTATHSVSDVRECWVGYVDGICSQCSCQNCDDSTRGNKPDTR